MASEPPLEESPDEGLFGDDLSLDEIEAAYLKALEAADLTEISLQEEFAPNSDGIPADADAFDSLPSAGPGDGRVAEEPSALSHAAGRAVEFLAIEPEAAGQTTASARVESSDGDWRSSELGSAVGEVSADRANADQAVEMLSADENEPQVRAEQVVEALLFVGGAPLPVKKFLDVLGGAHAAEQVETILDALNERYLCQRRPYEVRLVEGGYRLQLREEFEPVRSRAYGQGPKEVKLAQDALEVLAFVAYQQPISREELAEAEKPNLPALLRQLLRRELICVDRSQPEAGEQYRTTTRFLELFGLTSLEDLPQAGTFQFR